MSEGVDSRPDFSLWYLTDLMSNAAIEVDKYIFGKDYDMSNIRRLAEVLDKYKVKGNERSPPFNGFPYFQLIDAIEKGSKKRIGDCSDLALEMKLILLELKDFPESSKDPKQLLSFIVDFGMELVRRRAE